MTNFHTGWAKKFYALIVPLIKKQSGMYGATRSLDDIFSFFPPRRAVKKPSRRLFFRRDTFIFGRDRL